LTTPDVPAVLYVSQIPGKAAQAFLNRAVAAAASPGHWPVPVCRHDGVQVGAVISAGLAHALEGALEDAGMEPSGLLDRQTDPEVRAVLGGISRRLRAQYGSTRNGD
jgi:hypothetical protein